MRERQGRDVMGDAGVTGIWDLAGAAGGERQWVRRIGGMGCGSCVDGLFAGLAATVLSDELIFYQMSTR